MNIYIRASRRCQRWKLIDARHFLRVNFRAIAIEREGIDFRVLVERFLDRCKSFALRVSEIRVDLNFVEISMPELVGRPINLNRGIRVSRSRYRGYLRAVTLAHSIKRNRTFITR